MTDMDPRSKNRGNTVPDVSVSPEEAASPILANLSDEQSSKVLFELVARRHVSVAETETLAVRALSRRSRQEVADGVVAAIGAIGGYELFKSHVDKDFQAARELFNRALSPFLQDIRRYSSLGLHDVALETCRGVLLGLFRVEQKRAAGVLPWILESFARFAHDPLLALPGTARDEQGRMLEVPAWVKEFAREHLPGWDFLHE